MSFPKVETETVHYIDGDKLVKWCNDHYDMDIDPVGDGGVAGDDSSGFLKIRVTSGSQALKNVDLKTKMKEDRYSFTYNSVLEKALVENGCPEGSYILEFTWG